MELRRQRLALVAITLSAAAVRLIYATLPRLVRWDEAGHLMVARNLVAGQGFTGRAGIPDMHLPPALPLLSAGLIKLGFTLEWATALIHIVTGALLCVPVYLLARAIYGRRVGLLAAALVAVYPALAAQPFLWGTMTESPFLLCVFTGLWAVYRALDMPQFGSAPRPLKPDVAACCVAGSVPGPAPTSGFPEQISMPGAARRRMKMGRSTLSGGPQPAVTHAASGATAPSGENGAEHPERRATARSRRMRSGLWGMPHPSTAPGPLPRLRSGCSQFLEQFLGQTGAVGWYAAVGLCFGLAYLTRPEGLTYFAVLGLFMVLWHLAHRTFWRAATWARLALTVIVCLAVISPYVLFLHRVSGQWTLSGKVGLILDIAPAYIAHDQVAHDVAVSRLDSTGQEVMWFSPERFQRKFSAYVLENPSRFFYYMRRNMAETWDALFHQTLFSPWVVALAGIGLFARPWRRRRWWQEGLLWAALLPLASFWLFFVIDRFLIGALPIGLIWAAAGLAHVTGWAVGSLRARRPRPAGWLRATVAALPVALALAFSLWLGLEQLQAGLARMSWSHKDAGHWLASVSAPDDIIMTRSAEVGLYADRGSVTSPNATWAELLAYARSHNARFLVVDDYEVTKIRPQFDFLLHPETAPPEVAHLRTFAGTPATLVYRFVE